ncbi:dihydroxyacetone kinase [Arthrobacter sp. Hiyo4]|nr:dihydroxyacetone kinase [Arthrobacter sp. Hiyo4]
MTVRLVVVSHSEKIADGAVELAAQMAPDVVILAAGAPPTAGSERAWRKSCLPWTRRPAAMAWWS